MKIKLEQVHYMPKELEPGVLYVSEEFHAAAHLCPCGCGSIIRTPPRPTEWSLEVSNGLPTLNPSIGNWQKPCKSHYWISEGQIFWSDQWTSAEIAAGRRKEENRRRLHYEALYPERTMIWKAVWQKIREFMKRFLTK
jgi:hypothetical protein